MEWLVNIMVEANDSDAVMAEVGSWTLSPGAVVLNINSAQPVVALSEPVEVDDTGKVKDMKKVTDQPSVVSTAMPVESDGAPNISSTAL